MSYVSGYGTTHKVNSLILQGSFGNTNTRVDVLPPKNKRRRRSFVPTSTDSETNFRYKKRIGPMPIRFPENEVSDFIIDDSNKRNFLWTLMRQVSTEFVIPSWTGFQISISNGIPLLKTTVGYLDCIDSSATEMSTIYQVRNKNKFLDIYTTSFNRVKLITLFVMLFA